MTRWVLFFALSILLYWPSLTGQFILDDWAYIIENTFLTEAELPFRFWTQLQQADFWPMSYTVYWTLWKLFGENTLPYHLTSLFLHSWNAWLLTELLVEYEIAFPWLGGLLFLAHPIQVQAVAWIFQLKTLLSTTFFLLAWRSLLRRTEIRSWVWFLCSLLSKTSSVIFPGILLAHFIFKRKQPTRRQLGLISMSSALALTFSGITIYVNHQNYLSRGVSTWDAETFERVMVVAQNFWFYVKSIFAPLPRIFIHPKTMPDPSQLVDWFPLILLSGWIFFLLWRAWLARQRDLYRMSAFGMAIYLIGLLPALGFVNIPYMKFSFVADHWTYLAMLGVPFAILPLLSLFTRFRFALPVFATATVGTLGIITWNQAALYRHEDLLLQDTLQKNPNSSFAWYCFGVSRYRFQHSDEGEKAFAKAYSLSPGETMASYNLAAIYVNRYEFDRAIPALVESIRWYPLYPSSYKTLGQIYEYQHKIDQAFQTYQAALNLHAMDLHLWSPDLFTEICRAHKTPAYQSYSTRYFSPGHYPALNECVKSL